MNRPLAALTGIAVIAGVTLLGFGGWQLANPTPNDAPTSERRAVAPSEVAPLPPAAVPHALTIPALGFQSEVFEFQTGGAPELNPPDAERAYWLSDYGLPGAGSDNTVYLIGHTSADGRAVFDPLVDREAQHSRVLPGDEIWLETATGTVVYETIAVERHERQRLADVDNVWTTAPGRLVLVTCFFEASTDTVSDNLVVFARALNDE
ncbi:class F sortase [Leucobacter albus]|uniref:Class F sortase n=1 Tax=Leucobacter albus TaxID=272210 RepID=A0ABW3TR26_9MICO